MHGVLQLHALSASALASACAGCAATGPHLTCCWTACEASRVPAELLLGRCQKSLRPLCFGKALSLHWQVQLPHCCQTSSAQQQLCWLHMHRHLGLLWQVRLLWHLAPHCPGCHQQRRRRLCVTLQRSDCLCHSHGWQQLLLQLGLIVLRSRNLLQRWRCLLCLSTADSPLAQNAEVAGGSVLYMHRCSSDVLYVAM